MELINAAAPVILVFMAIGIMFGVVKLRSVGFFLLALLFLPFLFSSVKGAAHSVSFSHLSWKAWLVIIAGGLIALRLLLNRVFRR